ncbi:MAG: hypothetical protein GX493_05875 [Firmicutes bacterium]|nr:hypothetical protein [Bacillota bacterium]
MTSGQSISQNQANAQPGGQVVPHPAKILETARGYLARGWRVIPVPLKEKGLTEQGWQKLRLTEEDLPEHFGREPRNIGVLLGEPSGWLIDVDLDDPAAVKLAPRFLPETKAVFGHASKPASHWLYISRGAEYEKLVDPNLDPNDKKATILEVRSTGRKGGAHQTIFPGSVHPSGEEIRWDSEGDPAEVSREELLSACKKTAAAALLAKYWAKPGTRQDAALALAGGLLSGGWTEDAAREFILAVAETAGDEEAAKRAETVRHTAEKLEDGDPTTGWPRLAELVGEKTVEKAREWLGIKRTHSAAPPVVELLDDIPARICRPLALVNCVSYAAIWPYVKVIVAEEIDKKGRLIKHDPPIEITEQRLMIVRNDGRIFGDGGDEPLRNLGLDVDLPEIPQNEKLWSTPGVKKYKNGYRPEPIHVFYRVVDVIDRFIDFNQSLADQRTMAELAGCYVLATYFLDAFTVIGFLWSTGEGGSGKTTLLDVICAMAYIGQVVTLGGSFASLRDLADYGACIAFDDVENLSDPKKTDPDKRSLLLAGNHRGNTIPFKELVGDKWRTRYVNTFCPRLFSAIQCPDPVLASRTIMIPLIPSTDKYKTDADPLKPEQWPHDRRKLIDYLWAMGLAYLPAIPAYDTKAANAARLSGRRLDPWRAILAVAAWLDDLGMEKRDGRTLFERMEALSWAYQTERYDIESANLTVLTVKALVSLFREGEG